MARGRRRVAVSSRMYSCVVHSCVGTPHGTPVGLRRHPLPGRRRRRCQVVSNADLVVEGGEEGCDDVVADVVVAERGELLAHGVDGDSRQVAAHRWIRAARARESACSHALSERNNERCSLRNGPFLQHRMNISLVASRPTRARSSISTEDPDAHSFFARARRRCGPSPRSSRREYHWHVLNSSSSRRRVTAASPHDASRATTRTAGDAPSQPRRHTRSSHHPSSQRAPRPRPRSMTSRPRRFPFKAAASRLAMPPSSRAPPPRASPSSPESPTQSHDQFRPMETRVGKPRPFQTRHPTSEPRAHPTTHAAATTSSHHRHSSHWSQRSQDRRTGTTQHPDANNQLPKHKR